MPMPPRKPRPSHQLLSNNSLIKDNGNGRYFAAGGYGGGMHMSPLSLPLPPFPNSSSAGSTAAGVYPPQNPNPQQQQQSQPPLITDTLTACLDVNGTYICTPYSPRCYIIQKVTPNSVTVTPTPQIPLTPTNHATTPGTSVQIPGSSGLLGTVNQIQSRAKFNNAHGQGPSAQTSLMSHQVPLTFPSSYRFSPLGPNHVSAHKHIIINSSTNQLGSGGDHMQKPKTICPNSSPQTGSRVYMNGEIGSSLPPVGDVSMPSMGYIPNCNAGSHVTDNRSLSGVVRNGPGIMSGDTMALNNDAGIDEGAIRNALVDQAQRSTAKDEQGSTSSSDLPPEELRQLMITQLEYYFSPENLSNDKFLVSQMDSDQYVYISTVSNFNMIKKLSSDLDLITEVLKESKQVQVHSDGKRVRPISNRTVVILRGIPESTPVEEIKVLFEKENAPKCNNCEFAANDSWYLSFDSDDEAIRAHRYLREDVREFKGQPIMARIKSRPTTLLSQGVGVPQMKNGFHPSPQHTQNPYVNISTAYVPGSQPGTTNTVVATPPLFANGQPVSSTVFTLPQNPYGSFPAQLPWGGYYDLNHSMTPMYSINGLPPPTSQQPSPSYPKPAQMPLRHRNPNLPRGPRPRQGPGDSHMHNSNGVPSHQYGGSGVSGVDRGGGQHRKTNNPTAAPTPLLGMAPATLPLGVHPPLLSHNHHGHSIPTSINNSNVASVSTTRNGGHGHYGGGSGSGMSGPSQQQSIPHVNNHSMDSYSSNSRSYRGDSRPRSSLSNRKTPQRHRDDEGGYESAQGSSSATSSTRGNPSTRTVAPSPVSPQISNAQVSSNSQQQQGRTNFDLEVSPEAFPPLPGSADSALRNGETPYEGRLSDVVKGVKSLKVATNEKEDVAPTAVRITSDGSNAGVPESHTPAPYAVPISPSTKDDEIAQPSQPFAAALPGHGIKKEFREVGVGSADDRNDVHTPSSREEYGGRETADKSTRTDTSLLHGDKSVNGPRGVESRSGGGVENQQGGNSRKSVPQSTKSPVVGKRGVPGSGFQSPPTTTVAVGPEVPYSNQQNFTTSPVSSPVKSSPFNAASGAVNSNSNRTGVSGGVGRNGSGAVTYVAKTQMDNNRSGGGASGGSSQNPRGGLNTSDKDAFPTPVFSKSNVPMGKPFSGATEHSSKEGNRIEDDEKRKIDEKKSDDNICSNEDRDGSVRLSYAQVAQSGKEKPSVSASNSMTQVAQSSHPPSTATVNNVGGSASSGVQGPHTDDKKRPFNEAKDMRTQYKPQYQHRSNNGPDGPDRDRDRGDRDRGDRGDRERNYRPRYRGDRPRMSTEHSQDGASGGRPPSRGIRSPK